MRLLNLRDIELYMTRGPNEPWKVCKKVFPHLVKSHRMHNLKFSRQEQAFRGELLLLLLLSCCCYCCCCCGCGCGWAIVRRWSHFLAAVFVPVFLQPEVLATYFDGRDEYATLVRAVKTFSSVISLSTKHNNDSNNSNNNTTQTQTPRTECLNGTQKKNESLDFIKLDFFYFPRMDPTVNFQWEYNNKQNSLTSTRTTRTKTIFDSSTNLLVQHQKIKRCRVRRVLVQNLASFFNSNFGSRANLCFSELN